MKLRTLVHLPRLLATAAALLGSSLAHAQSLSTLMYFNGSQSAGGLTFGVDGALYGVSGLPQGASVESSFGNGALGGLVYRLTTDASRVDSIHQFGEQAKFDGSGPRGALARDASGNFYGVTAYNAIDSTTGLRVGSGTIFKLTPSGTYTRLYQFSDLDTSSSPFLNSDGASPVASLLLASDGFLYGTTLQGGTNGAGTVFRLGVDGSGFAVLHHFAAISANNVDGRPMNADGAQVQSRLMIASNGDLYGAASSGGANGTGTIFRLHPDGTNFALLFTFDVSPEPDTTTGALQTNATGAYPSSGLLQAANGLLYGTAQLQGANGYGNIYQIAADGSGFAVLQSFDSTNGAYPSGELIVANDGTIAGTTSAGATLSDGTTPGAGTLYSMTTDGSTLTTLYVFGTDGASPQQGVIQAGDGSFYGATAAGGPYNQGTVFKFGPATNATPQGTPPPFDDGGAIEWWMVAALALILFWKAHRSVNRADRAVLRVLSP